MRKLIQIVISCSEKPEITEKIEKAVKKATKNRLDNSDQALLTKLLKEVLTKSTLADCFWGAILTSNVNDNSSPEDFSTENSPKEDLSTENSSSKGSPKNSPEEDSSTKNFPSKDFSSQNPTSTHKRFKNTYLSIKHIKQGNKVETMKPRRAVIWFSLSLFARFITAKLLNRIRNDKDKDVKRLYKKYRKNYIRIIDKINEELCKLFYSYLQDVVKNSSNIKIEQFNFPKYKSVSFKQPFCIIINEEATKDIANPEIAALVPSFLGETGKYKIIYDHRTDTYLLVHILAFSNISWNEEETALLSLALLDTTNVKKSVYFRLRRLATVYFDFFKSISKVQVRTDLVFLRYLKPYIKKLSPKSTKHFQSLKLVFNFYKEHALEILKYSPILADYRGRVYNSLSFNLSSNISKKYRDQGYNFGYYGSKFARYFFTINNKHLEGIKDSLNFDDFIIIIQWVIKFRNPNVDTRYIGSENKVIWLKKFFPAYREKVINLNIVSKYTKKLILETFEECSRISRVNASFLSRKILEDIILLLKLGFAVSTGQSIQLFADVAGCCLIQGACLAGKNSTNNIFSTVGLYKPTSGFYSYEDPYIALIKELKPKLIEKCKEENITPDDLKYIEGFCNNRTFLKSIIFGTMVGRSILTLREDYKKEPDFKNDPFLNFHREKIFNNFTVFLYYEVKNHYKNYFNLISIISYAIKEHFSNEQYNDTPFVINIIHDFIIIIENIPFDQEDDNFRINFQLPDEEGIKTISPIYISNKRKARSVHGNELRFIFSVVQHGMDACVCAAVSKAFSKRNLDVLTLHDSFFIDLKDIKFLNLAYRKAILKVSKEFKNDLRKLVDKYELTHDKVKITPEEFEDALYITHPELRRSMGENIKHPNLFRLLFFFYYFYC